MKIQTQTRSKLPLEPVFSNLSFPKRIRKVAAEIAADRLLLFKAYGPWGQPLSLSSKK
jgi:hypothetical protein